MNDTTTTILDIDRLGVSDIAVNGPEDLLDWDAVDWRRQSEQVRRLRQRIFKATRDGDLERLRNLQKLMLRSRANTLVSVRQVTQRSTGRHTGGIDGQVALTSRARAELARRLHAAGVSEALPVRRVHIPKKGGKRPLGIPAIADRAEQQRVRNALEPEWEARLDQKQYGFRPGRGCHDAVVMIHRVLATPGAKREWVLDADLASAFDRIDHTVLLDRVGLFPAREQIRQWLKAGVVDKGRFTPTTEGTPQGGVISPLLLNIALQGLEKAVGVTYNSYGKVRPGCPAVVTYADDFVVLCHSREQAEVARNSADTWLKERGLSLHPEKTAIRHIDDGFDFLSFTIRRYHTRGGVKVLTTPSRDVLTTIRRRITDELHALRGAPPLQVINTLNPVIRGQANYFRPGASTKAYNKLDAHLWWSLYKWARHRHPGKGRHWVTARYFGQYHPTRQDRWVFGDRDSGAYLHHYAWTAIVRHVPVKGRNSPDDPDLAPYWANRRRRTKPPQLAESYQRALRAQNGRCPLCRGPLLPDSHPPNSPTQWERWFTATRAETTYQTVPTGSSSRTKHRLVHANCARHHRDGPQPGTNQQQETPDRP